MSSAVNPSRRTYDSSRRQARAAETRAAVLSAAREAFLDRGFAATTIPEVAARAGVSMETVYKAFGNKAGLVKSVFDVALAGDDEPIPFLQREFVARNMAEPNPRRKLTAYGEHLSAIALRTNPILLVLRDAAVADQGAAQAWEAVQDERLIGMSFFAGHLHDAGHLRCDVTVEDARDVLWTYNAVEMWDLLVRQRRWSNQRYGSWIGEQLVAALLS